MAVAQQAAGSQHDIHATWGLWGLRRAKPQSPSLPRLDPQVLFVKAALLGIKPPQGQVPPRIPVGCWVKVSLHSHLRPHSHLSPLSPSYQLAGQRGWILFHCLRTGQQSLVEGEWALLREDLGSWSFRLGLSLPRKGNSKGFGASLKSWLVSSTLQWANIVRPDPSQIQCMAVFIIV